MRVQRYHPDHGLVETTTVADPPPETVNADTLHDRVDQAIDTLDDYADRWLDLTAAQRTAAMGLAVRTVARIARLTLGRLESAR